MSFKLLSVAVIQHTDLGEERVNLTIHVTILHGEKSRQELQLELKAETVEECTFLVCPLTHFQIPAQLVFSRSPNLPA